MEFSDPTTTIDSLVGKFTLSLIIMAAAFIFYGMIDKNTPIPRNIAVTMAIILLLLCVAVSIIATYEFFRAISKYENCSKSCLYDKKSLNFIKNFYLSFSVIFILTNIYICHLLIKYHK
jgi:protein-S-isoprenylcysteine O-methyltransferase Ste14